MATENFAQIVIWKEVPYRLPSTIFYGPTDHDRPEKHVVLLKLGETLIVVLDAEVLRKQPSPIVLDSNPNLVREVTATAGTAGTIIFPEPPDGQTNGQS